MTEHITDLSFAVEGFAAEVDKNRNKCDIAINSVMGTVEQINRRLLRVAEGFIQKSARLTKIAKSLQAISFPSFQDRITAIENTQLVMQADISSIKGMVTRCFKRLRDILPPPPQKKPPYYTEGEQLLIFNIKKPKFKDVEKELEVEDVVNEPEHEPYDTKPISITIIRLITKPALEVEMIRSSSRLQLIYIILEVQITQPEPQHITPKPDKGKGKATNSDESPKKLVKASTEVHLDPDASVLIPFEINGKLYQLTNAEIQAHMEMKERKEKAFQEANLLALSKLELIKVVHKEATKAGVDHKALSSRKGGQEFLKIQDAKIKSLTENTIKRSRRKNSSGRKGLISIDGPPKKKRQELELEVRIHRFKCNRSLPKGVSLVNNLVIERPKNGIFFIDVFGDEAFQRMSDIQKVDVDSFLSYLVMASNSSTPANQRLAKIAKSLQAISFPSFQDRITAIENTQLVMQADISSIKGTVTRCFKRLRDFLPPPPQPNKGKGKATNSDESPKKLVKASTKVHSDPDASVLIPFEINGKLYQLTNAKIQAHMEMKERKEKAAQEANLLALSKLELIKVVHEEATKAGVDPKALSSRKGGQEFLKIQDAKIKSLIENTIKRSKRKIAQEEKD
nr:hypothetical protein [Tanacetum cinerariifolium]